MDFLADHITHYRRDAEEFDYFEEPSPLNRDASRRIQEAVMREARLPKSGRVLDAGSGNGWLTGALRGTECLVVSVDLGLRNLERIRREHPGALCVCADLYRLPFREGSFDRVVCSEVLEHANDPEAVVAACAAVLKPDGRLTVSTPYREVIRRALCIHCNRPTPMNAHLHSFDEQRHEKAFAAAGLVHVRTFVFQNVLFLRSRLSWLCRKLPYPLWRILDRFFSLLYRRNATIVVSGALPERTG